MKGLLQQSFRSGVLAVPLFLGGLLSLNSQAATTECVSHLTAFLSDRAALAPRAVQGMQVVMATLKRPNGQQLGQLRDQEIAKLHYVVTADGQMHFLDHAVSLPQDQQLFGQVGDQLLPIREGGVLHFRDGRFAKDQTYGFDLSQEEVAAAEASLRSRASFSERLTHTWGRFRESKVMDCAQGLRDPPRAKDFVLSKVGMDLSLMTGSILILAPDRFDSLLVKAGLQEEDPNRDYDGDLLAADYTASTTNTFVKGIAGFFIASQGMGFRRSLGYRIPLTATSVGLQALLYATLTDNNAAPLGAFNAGYSAFALVKSHFVDKALVKQLPNWVMQACIVNPRLKILVSQGSVRLAEGLATTVLYMGARRAIVGE
jgi:hypothetical protein